MRHLSEEIQELRAKAEASLNKKSQFHQILAQLEANISREENQKVNQKFKRR